MVIIPNHCQVWQFFVTHFMITRKAAFLIKGIRSLGLWGHSQIKKEVCSLPAVTFVMGYLGHCTHWESYHRDQEARRGNWYPSAARRWLLGGGL